MDDPLPGRCKETIFLFISLKIGCFSSSNIQLNNFSLVSKPLAMLFRIYILIIFFLIGLTKEGFTQIRDLSSMYLRIPDTPRTKANADKPGHYELMIQVDNNEIDPGCTANISIYISGYGEIGGSK